MKKSILVAFGTIILGLAITFSEIIPSLGKENSFKLYGADYLSIFLVLIAQGLLKGKNKFAFVFYILAYLFNMILGFIVGSAIMIVYSSVGIYIMIKNYRQWSKDEQSKTFEDLIESEWKELNKKELENLNHRDQCLLKCENGNEDMKYQLGIFHKDMNYIGPDQVPFFYVGNGNWDALRFFTHYILVKSNNKI